MRVTVPMVVEVAQGVALHGVHTTWRARFPGGLIWAEYARPTYVVDVRKGQQHRVFDFSGFIRIVGLLAALALLLTIRKGSHVRR